MQLSSEAEDEALAEDRIGAPVGPLPSTSSKVNYQEIKTNPTIDLWVVGSGTLGAFAVQQWLALHPGSRVVAETASSKKHEALAIAGSEPRLRASRSLNDEFCARNVLICLPPSAVENYEEELSLSFRLWAGPEKGNLVFTSSTVVYGDSFGNTVDEKFRLDTRSSRSFKMICAEEVRHIPFRSSCHSLL
jgi:hypothetical protein